MKKTLSIVLVLAMVLCCAPVFTASAETADITEIEFFTSRSFEGSAGTDLEKDNFVEQYLRENIGVDINFKYTDDLGTNLNTRLYAGDVPELFNVPNRNYLINYASEEYLLNMDEYADQLANAFAFTEGNAAAGKVDGVTYAIAGRPYGFRLATWYNVNAFNAAGVEAPTTLDEYIEAIRTVAAADIDGNGVNDTIGLSGTGWNTFCQFFGAYGCTNPNILSLDANGDVVDTMLTENFYDALVVINGLWEEGLIDHEVFSQNDNNVREKGMTEAAATIHMQWPGIKKVGDWANWTSVDPDACWEIVGPLTGPDGTTNYVGNYASAGFTSLSSIGADLDADVTEAALKVLDFFGTDDGISLTTYGIEGVHWDYNEEGVPTVREDQITAINFSWIYQLCGRDELSYCRVKFGEDAWKYVVQSHEQPYLTDVTSLIDDPEWYNGTDAETYISEECAKFVTGQRELSEAEWAAFIETLNTTYKYSQFIEEANAAWHAMVG